MNKPDIAFNRFDPANLTPEQRERYARYFLEAYGQVTGGYFLRAAVAVSYLLLEVRRQTSQSGSLTTGLFWALGLGGLWDADAGCRLTSAFRSHR